MSNRVGAEEACGAKPPPAALVSKVGADARDAGMTFQQLWKTLTRK